MAFDRFPAVDEDYQFPPEIRAALATSLDLRNTVIPMTQVQRNNLSGSDLWDGRLVLNTTTDRVNRYDLDSTSWVVLYEAEDVLAAIAAAEASAADDAAWVQDDGFTVSGIVSGDYTRSGRTRLVGDTLQGNCHVHLNSGSSAELLISGFDQAPNVGGNGPFRILTGENRPVGSGFWSDGALTTACPFVVMVDPATKKLHLMMLNSSTPNFAGISPQGLGANNHLWFDFEAEVE